MIICQLEEEVGQALFFLSHAVTFQNMTMKDQSNISKMQRSLQNINKQTMEACCRHMHRLPALLFTYYELPFKKDTLLSLCPLEDCGCAGLEATCLTRQPGE